MVVGGVFFEVVVVDVVVNYIDLIGVGQGILIDLFFGKKILDGQGDKLFFKLVWNKLKRLFGCLDCLKFLLEKIFQVYWCCWDKKVFFFCILVSLVKL